MSLSKPLQFKDGGNKSRPKKCALIDKSRPKKCEDITKSRPKKCIKFI